MGTGNLIKCNKCSYEKEFMLGYGMLYGDVDRVVSFLDKKNRDRATEVMKENHQNYTFDFEGRAIFQCRKCFSVEENEYIVIRDKEKKLLFRTYSECKKCKIKRRKLPMRDEIVKEFYCPKCKTDSVEVHTGIMWD